MNFLKNFWKKKIASLIACSDLMDLFLSVCFSDGIPTWKMFDTHLPQGEVVHPKYQMIATYILRRKLPEGLLLPGLLLRINKDIKFLICSTLWSVGTLSYA